MRLWSSEEAARELGISSRRVRALARAGKVKARKIGTRWLVELVGHRAPRPGRPVSSSTAWAMLATLSGERPSWIHPSALSRLARRMRDQHWVLDTLGRSAPRSRIFQWRVLPSDIARISRKPGIVLTGASAAVDEVDLTPSSTELDAYVNSHMLRLIEEQFKPAKAPDQPNLTLRVPANPWVLTLRRAPLAVIGADLLLSSEPRASRAGREVLTKVLHH